MKNGTFPSKLLLYLTCVPIIFYILYFVLDIFLTVGILFNVLLFLAVVLDLFLSPNYKKDIDVIIEIEEYQKLNSYSPFTVEINNKNKLKVKFQILLDLDISFDRRYADVLIKVPPLTEQKIDFKVFASRRGRYTIEHCFLKGKSLMSLLYFYRKKKQDVKFNVVPTTFSKGDSFRFLQKKIAKYEGQQKNILIGDGKEFEMLRDYVKGDEFSKIDWKASARNRKPVTKVYRLENTFNLAIMLDCGRLMSTEIKGLSMLDYSINASVLLSYAAVKTNDNVSLTAFSSGIKKYIPPSRNVKTINKFNYILTDLQYDFVESDYQTAFAFMHSKLTKRSLIVIFTDILDDTNLATYHKYFSLLMRKHIVLLVLLKDKNLFDVAHSIPGKSISLHTRASAIDLVVRRNKTIHNLKRLGIEVLDLFPEEVTSSTLNKYLNIKRLQ